VLSKRLIELRKQKNKTQEDIAKVIGVTRPAYTAYERGLRTPDYDILVTLADYFDVSVDYLLGRTDNPNPPDQLPELTEQDEKDIAKDLEKIIKNLSTDGYAHFDGRSLEELDEEDKQLLIASLENSMRLAKRLAKEKFTPKKYKK